MTDMDSSRPYCGRDEEPIAALSTGGGAAAVAVIRISGQQSLSLLNTCLASKLGRLSSWAERKLYLCQFKNQHGAVIDEPLAVVFKGPRSFTGQDAAEIHCHGGPYIVGSILSELWRVGMRPADPGEFTRRAFLNGKLDLTRAEGIKALVEAQSQQQWLAARQLATGRLAETIESLRTQLVEAMAYLEAQIDFPDEGETAALHLGHVRQRVQKVSAAVQRLTATYDSGKVASRGLMVVLFGPPNAGKSTLMNELLGRDRAIVTAVAGTTRDYLEEKCLVKGRLIRLVDMAGVRELSSTNDAIERMGIERSLALAKEADLVLALAGADEVNRTALNMMEVQLAALQPRSVLNVVTKVDLIDPDWGADCIKISCKSGEGLEHLRDVLAARVDRHVSDLKEETFVTSTRHVQALRMALTALEQFAAVDAVGAYEEILAFELQQAAKALRAIIGEVDADDVLDKVFSEFCIGK